MPLLKELGTAVRQRRQEIGLSQQRVADLADLSRATINELETGRLQDLSAHRAERLANELGFALGLIRARRDEARSVFESAGRVASVPYRLELPADVLRDCVRQGTVPPGYIPQLRTLLQESPVAMLADMAEELERTHKIPRQDTWKRLRMLGAVLKADRRLWQSLPS